MLVESLSGHSFPFTDSEIFTIGNSSTQMYLYANTAVTTYTVANYTIYQALLIDIEAFSKLGKFAMGDIPPAKWLLSMAVDSLYSSLLYGLQSLFDIFLNLLFRLSVTSDLIDYFILFLSSFDLFICLAIGWILSRFIQRYEEKIMHVFLELPRKYMIYLNAQCENFISELQV